MTDTPTNGALRRLAAIPAQEPGSSLTGSGGGAGEIVNAMWSAQDSALRLRDRQIEENVRMLAGQQWTVFNPLLGRWVDISQFFSDDERRWRQRPVFNRIFPWFLVTHARMTENPAIVTYIPGPDRLDAELAETLDTIMKALWREADVNDAWDRVAAWMLTGGVGYMHTGIDMTSGPLEPWVGEAELPLFAPDGSAIPDQAGQGQAMVPMPNVPFGPDGQPLAVAILQPDPESGEPVPTMKPLGQPHMTRSPRLVVDVLSPFEVRGEWGPTPWHRKAWHMTRSLMTPAQVFERFGVDASSEATTNGGQGVTDSGELNRILFGTGYYGPAVSTLGGDAQSAQAREGFIDVRGLWVRPQGPEDEGRYLAVTSTGMVLRDGPRPVQYPHTSPIRIFEFARLPGRGATSPQDVLNGANRALNKRWAQLFEHAALVTNPKPIIDEQSGLSPSQWTNEPGKAVIANRRSGVPAVDWLQPPSLGSDVWRLLGELRQEFAELAMIRGTEGAPPSDDPSGELVKELRFNADRYLGPTLRRAPAEFGRMMEDWIALLPTIYPFDRLVEYAGEDNVARTLVVRNELFKQGKVHVIADAESMLPEGRNERQERVTRMYAEGLFGPPGSPMAVRTYFEVMRFPHLGRAAKPGGVDRITAEQENAKLIQGADPQSLPVFPWYDSMTHLDVHEQFMKSPEFLKQPPEVIEAFAMHRDAHLNVLAAQGPPGGPPPPEPGGGGRKPRPDDNGPPPLYPGPAGAPDSIPSGTMPGALPS